jgi:nucleotide-binding universal stress UspA family protein
VARFLLLFLERSARKGGTLVQCFKKLLVAITPDMPEQPALRRAVQLAQSNDAELDVIEVMEETPHHAGLLMKRLRVEATLEDIKRETMRRLEALVTPLKATGIKVHTHVATGTPFLEIIRTMLRDHHDLVVKAIEPEREWKQMFLGSTDLHLLRKCPGGLWLVKPAEPTRYRRILVAIDPDTEDPVKRELAVRLLHMATSLAQSEGAELLIGHAWTPFAEGKFKDHLNTAEFRSYLRSSKQESASRLQTLLSVVGARPSQKVQLVKGKASIVIPRLAKRHAVDLVVMGTIGRSGIPGLLIGNTAERLLNRLECSILTLKLPGFVSPVS